MVISSMGSSPTPDLLQSGKLRMQEFFSQLQAQRTALAMCLVGWEEVQEYLNAEEGKLQKREEEYAEREKSLESTFRVRQESLDKREAALASREVALGKLTIEFSEKDLAGGSVTSGSVENKEYGDKRSFGAAAAFEEGREKSSKRKDHGDGKDETGQTEEEERPPRSKELKASVSTFSGTVEASSVTAKQAEAETAYSPQEEEEEEATEGTGQGGREGCGKRGRGVDVSGGRALPITGDESNGLGDSEQGTTVAAGSHTQAQHLRAQVGLELRVLCEAMDGQGLLRFLTQKWKDAGALKHELPLSLLAAPGPCKLVLASLSGYPLPGVLPADNSSPSPALRRSSILLLESLATAMEEPTFKEKHAPLQESLQAEAKALADTWQAAGVRLDETGSLDVQAFLQLLATFQISSQYDPDLLCSFLTVVARRKQSPALCRALGLTDKMPDFVGRLCREGRQIEALVFANAFGIMDQVAPVALLKNHMQDVKKEVAAILKAGNSSPAAQNEATAKEMASLRAVLRAVQEYGLEAEVSPESIQKRMALLDKAKLDRKRAAVALKAHTKRPRGPSGGPPSVATGIHRPAASNGSSVLGGAGRPGGGPGCPSRHHPNGPGTGPDSSMHLSTNPNFNPNPNGNSNSSPSRGGDHLSRYNAPEASRYSPGIMGSRPYPPPQVNASPYNGPILGTAYVGSPVYSPPGGGAPFERGTPGSHAGPPVYMQSPNPGPRNGYVYGSPEHVTTVYSTPVHGSGGSYGVVPKAFNYGTPYQFGSGIPPPIPSYQSYKH